MLITLLIIIWVVIWILLVVDLVRRRDLSLVAKLLWGLVMLVLPIIGAVIYLIARPSQPGDHLPGAPGDAPHATASDKERIGTHQPF